LFSLGNPKRLLPPPDGAQIGARFWETQHITDPAELAAYIISKAHEEWNLPMSAGLSVSRAGVWLLDFDGPCPEPMVGNIDARTELILRLEAWIERFSWARGEDRRFSGHMTLREPWEVMTYGIAWGTVENFHNSPWFRLRAHAQAILRKAQNSKYVKWFVLL
jgi:hypothetical protein